MASSSNSFAVGFVLSGVDDSSDFESASSSRLSLPNSFADSSISFFKSSGNPKSYLLGADGFILEPPLIVPPPPMLFTASESTEPVLLL